MPGTDHMYKLSVTVKQMPRQSRRLLKRQPSCLHLRERRSQIAAAPDWEFDFDKNPQNTQNPQVGCSKSSKCQLTGFTSKQLWGAVMQWKCTDNSAIIQISVTHTGTCSCISCAHGLPRPVFLSCFFYVIITLRRHLSPMCLTEPLAGDAQQPAHPPSGSGGTTTGHQQQ